MDLRNYSAEEILKDGTPVTVRAIHLEDRTSLLSEFEKLDPASIYTRFFAYKKHLTDTELNAATNVDFDRVVALVVTTKTEDGERLIGGGRYAIGDGPHTSAEIAFLTSDDFRGRGIAGLVLRHLVKIGRMAGIRQFDAVVLAQNQAMLSVFRNSGLPSTLRPEGGALHVVFSL